MSRKVMFPKSGAGSVSPRISLPISWLKELKITEDDREVDVEFNGKEIIIRKKEVVK